VNKYYLNIISRFYCYTAWSAIGIIMSVRPSVRLSVCNGVHCGS